MSQLQRRAGRGPPRQPGTSQIYPSGHSAFTAGMALLGPLRPLLKSKSRTLSGVVSRPSGSQSWQVRALDPLIFRRLRSVRNPWVGFQFGARYWVVRSSPTSPATTLLYCTLLPRPMPESRIEVSCHRLWSLFPCALARQDATSPGPVLLHFP